MYKPIFILRSLAILSLFLLAGCGKYNKADPFERVNRVTFAFNKTADKLIIKPVARTYDALLPKPVQTLVDNFFQNLREVPNVINDVLQGNWRLARHDTARFIINSTYGIGGLLDVAGASGMERHKQDYGLTLARWGYKESSYLVLPFLGPSTVRDGIGLAGLYYTWPPTYLKSRAIRNTLLITDYTDTRARLLKMEPVMDESVDEYVFLRTAYLQRRQYLINGAAKMDFNQNVALDEPPE